MVSVVATTVINDRSDSSHGSAPDSSASFCSHSSSHEALSRRRVAEDFGAELTDIHHIPDRVKGGSSTPTPSIEVEYPPYI